MARTPSNIASAARSGDHLKLLITLRARVARDIQNNPDLRPRDLASLTRQLRDINREIVSLGAEEKSDFTSQATKPVSLKVVNGDDSGDAF